MYIVYVQYPGFIVKFDSEGGAEMISNNEVPKGVELRTPGDSLKEEDPQ